MRRFFVPAVVALFGLVAVAGCGPVSAADAATVDGRDIPRSQLEDAVAAVAGASGVLEDADAERRAATVGPLQRQVLSLLIQARIIGDVADQRGIDLDQQAIDEQLEGEIEAAGGEDAFAGALAQSQLTPALYQDVLLPAQQRLAGVREELVAELPETETRTVRHILVESEDGAREIVELLDDGADFAELAEERSADPRSSQQGGDLGPRPRGTYLAAFEEAVWDAEIGEVVGPVQSEAGFHVLEVTDEATLSGDELGEQAREQSLEALLNSLLQEEFAAADVEVDAAFGVWDGERGAVVEADQVGTPQQPGLPGAPGSSGVPGSPDQ